ncbi:ABC transporter ATP-binding protein [Rhodococcus sp. HNM0563]|uniref:ABC transporter ATP-binding protein n=1 Tax=unclassified Rhodococcus (in: high G+C Gram-positive bacteria) TaxID=192944 RepID=UPI00146A5FF3|nr:MULTISPECIES: ABC transporter ATP-binding protein [unclassified Rhodococcus (in: high G+C Gram-positive bacteria)]MCK0092343.1 ABC transporter ATP-binding protein [Rhodococcus sp. F64268]NLU63089.1 ABC transporter ATP-binding protein [Rhodococcus sp. HNM0563]
MSTPLLQVENLTAGYGPVPVLHDVCFEVPAGTIAAVVGPNGAGKTTLLRALSGSLPAIQGTISVSGTSLVGVPTEKLVHHGVAHVPEGRGVIGELTVDENLRLGGLWRKDRADAARAVAEMYEMFEPLSRRRDSSGHQLSGGERQMLAIGRALVARPTLLLLDEPSLGLAPRIVDLIMTTLRDLRDRTGLTVVLVEQNVHSALPVADQAIVLSLGRVTVATSAAELAHDPEFRTAYLGF